MKRKKRIKHRGRSRFPHRRCPDFIEWIREQKCCITHRYGVDPAHIKPRSTGGDDLYNVVPLCRKLHDELHHIGIDSFQRNYTIDLAGIAHIMTERFIALPLSSQFATVRGSRSASDKNRQARTGQ